MTQATKVRLVLCPKCQNLLPELPNLAVYKCGGCGAVLQAKKQRSASDGSSEKSDEEKVRASSEKFESFPVGEGVVNLSGASDMSDKESDGIEHRRRRRVSVFSERLINSSSSCSSRNGNSEVETENIVASRHGRRDLEQETERAGKYILSSKDPIDSWVVGNDHEMYMNKYKSASVHLEKEIREIKPQIGMASRSGQIPEWRSGERDRSTAYRRTSRAVAEGVRLSTSPYPDEGPSNYHPGSSHGFGEPIKNLNDPLEPHRIEYLEQDRVELLRKLDQLKDQLSRSCDVSDKPKERVQVDGGAVPMDSFVSHDAWFPEASSGSNPTSLTEKHVQMPPYCTHRHDPFPLLSRHDMDMQNFYPPMHGTNEIPGYGVPFGRQMFSRAPYQLPCQYPQQSPNDYFSGQYTDIDPDYITSYPQNTFYNQPPCSCLHCYNKHWQVPAHIPPTVMCNRRFTDAPTNPMSYHVEKPGTFGPRVYNPRNANPPQLYFHESRPRRQGELDSEIGAFGQGCPPRVAIAKKNGRRCRPLAGGAPFITCHNCFELLSLPRKFLLMKKNQRELRCGACCTVISCLVESKKLVISVPVQTKEISSAVNDGSAVVGKGLVHSHRYANRGSSYSGDYDNSGCNFQTASTEPILSSIEQRLNLSKSENMQNPLSSSSAASEDEGSPDGVIAPRDVLNFAEVIVNSNVTPPVPGSLLRDHSSSDQLTSRFGKGNRSKRTNQEELVATKATSRQNSVKDASMATEIDVSFNEYSNSGISQDSATEISREEDRPRVSKGGDSFFVGFIKNFRDFNRSNVSINGQPISERLVKKAEKQAGTIHPGQYWYDFQAGFWGVMGQPCLGIIPPFIEEFKYPMPRDCSGGNTGVLVNGRELHEDDLDLLGRRGLPTARDKSYIIEISGRILDVDSGEELDCLGKLAPTVMRSKRGFGMRVERVVA